MKFPIKQSHFFAASVFGVAVLWFGALQAIRASTGMMDWSEMPALVMLAVLFSGLLAIAFNYIWLQVLEERGQSSEEPENYSPTVQVLGTIAVVLAVVGLLGAAQGYFVIGKTPNISLSAK